MKKEVIKFSVRKPKGRLHFALFDDDLPFKPKSEKIRIRYQRKPKHKFHNMEEF